MSLRHDARHRVLRPRRAAAVASLLSIALGSAGVAISTGSASAVPFSELDLAWTKPPASVGNGEPLRGVAHINLNDRLGEEGAKADHVVTFTATGGIFPRLPSACRTDGDPASMVSANGASLRCNLGRMRFGTAVEVDFGILAHGPDGDAVAVELTDGTTTATVRQIPIVAPPGVDVIFNEAQRVQANAAWKATFPIALSLPAGAADLKGPIAFDVVVADKTSTNAPAEIEPGSGCVALDSVTPPSSMPVTSDQAPIPTSCKVERTAPGTLHVVLDGYRTPAAVDPPGQAADGSALPTDRHFFAAFGLALQSPHGVSPATASFQMTIAHVSATTAGGAAAREVDTTNNTEEVAITVPGGYATLWGHPEASLPPLDTRVVGGGGPWAATYFAAPGDQIVAMSTSGFWGGQTTSTIPAGSTWSLCQILDGPGAFDGYVMGSVEGSNADPMAALPSGSYSWSVYSGPLPAPGSRDDFDCGSVSFARVGVNEINRNGGPCRCIAQEKLDIAAPAGMTAVRLDVDPAKLAQASPVGATPPRIGLHSGVRIAPSATPSDGVWTIGSARDQSGIWRTASSVTSSVTPTPGMAYASTNALRDVMRVIGSRPYVDKTVSQPVVRAGDVVTYSVRTGAEANLGTGQAEWKVTDQMPAGLDYIADSASVKPDSEARRPDGSTALTWSLHGPVNVDTVITYRARIAFTSGARANVAAASISAAGGSSTGRVQTDEDSAEVVYAGDGRTLLTKTAGSSSFAAGGANTWTLNLTNQDTVDQAATDIIDVLPWNGDARGSAFHGSYAIDTVESAGTDRILYATAKPDTISNDPAAASNGAFGMPSPMWSAEPPAHSVRVTAIRVVGSRLPVGSTKSTTITWHTINGRAGDTFENLATAKATHTRLQMIKAASTATVADGSKLQIAKLFESASGWSTGDRLSYRITVHNPSAKAALAVTVDDLGGNGQDAAGLRFSQLSQGTTAPGSATWRIGDLAPGATVTARVTLPIPTKADRSKPFENHAVVQNPSNPYEPPVGEQCQRNNRDVLADTDQCDFTSVEPPQLRIDKHADGATKDGLINWTVRVRLDGGAPAHDIAVLDTYPAGIDHSSIKVTAGPSRGTFSTTDGKWQIGTMKPGEVVSMSFQARVVAPAGSAIVNTATVDSPDVPRPIRHDGCQANDGPTVDAALDADLDQCDFTETTIGGPPPRSTPQPTPIAYLPETGGPNVWIGLLGATSGIAAFGVLFTGRRQGRPSHRG